MTAQEKQIVIEVLDWYKKISPILDKKYIGKSSKELLEIYKETEQKTTEEIIGKKATDYCEKYKGTDKYNVAMLAIEFGYQLFETRHNYIKKHTYSKIEKL
jgi:hypothetical protein